MDIFETLSRLGYGELHFGHDAASGLRALVGIHSTRLGPAIGGSRIRHYETEADAIDDVTRLAQGMAYKAAIARLPHGGGKAVIMAPADLGKWPADKRAALFRAFGSFVDNLGGRYITTEDSGTSTSDMDVVRTATKHVLGTSIDKGGSGDPSPFTALGCRRGIEAIAEPRVRQARLEGAARRGAGRRPRRRAPGARAGAGRRKPDHLRRRSGAAPGDRRASSAPPSSTSRRSSRSTATSCRRARSAARSPRRWCRSSSARPWPARPTTSCARRRWARRCRARHLLRARLRDQRRRASSTSPRSSPATTRPTRARRRWRSTTPSPRSSSARSSEKVQPEVIADRIAEERIAAGPHK